MDESLISLISLETAGALCLIMVAYKIYTLKSDNLVQSNCFNGCLKVKSHFSNPGGRLPERFTGLESTPDNSV